MHIPTNKLGIQCQSPPDSVIGQFLWSPRASINTAHKSETGKRRKRAVRPQKVQRLARGSRALPPVQPSPCLSARLACWRSRCCHSGMPSTSRQLQLQPRRRISPVDQHHLRRSPRRVYIFDNREFCVAEMIYRQMHTGRRDNRICVDGPTQP